MRMRSHVLNLIARMNTAKAHEFICSEHRLTHVKSRVSVWIANGKSSYSFHTCPFNDELTYKEKCEFHKAFGLWKEGEINRLFTESEKTE